MLAYKLLKLIERYVQSSKTLICKLLSEINEIYLEESTIQMIEKRETRKQDENKTILVDKFKFIKNSTVYKKKKGNVQIRRSIHPLFDGSYKFSHLDKCSNSILEREDSFTFKANIEDLKFRTRDINKLYPKPIVSKHSGLKLTHYIHIICVIINLQVIFCKNFLFFFLEIFSFFVSENF